MGIKIDQAIAILRLEEVLNVATEGLLGDVDDCAIRRDMACVAFGSSVILASKNLTKSFLLQHQIGDIKQDLGAEA